MNVPSRGKNHLFIGLVDKTKYKNEHLSNLNNFIQKFQLSGRILRVHIIGTSGTLN